MEMYKIVVKSYISDRNSSMYNEDSFSNKTDGKYIFDKECVNGVVEDLANEITGRISRHGIYGGIDKNVPTHFEVVDDLGIRGYISFSCVQVDVMIVVNFVRV